MRQHVVYILDLSMTFTFDLYVDGGVSLVSFTHSFNLLENRCQRILTTIVSNHIMLSLGGYNTCRTKALLVIDQFNFA